MRKNFLAHYPVHSEDKLQTLVENRTSFSYDECELSVYETHRKALDVSLTFDHFVLTSMLRGKKVMKLRDQSGFEYLPGESLILSPGERMVIDFPEARKGNPTQCIALTISDELIRQTINDLKEFYPKHDDWGNWYIDYSIFHMNNTVALSDTISRIMRISKEEHGKAKDMIVGLALQEMLIRLMQTQARHLFEGSYKVLADKNPLAAALKFIDHQLTKRIDLDDLADQACMSRASFFKKFKEMMGETPLQYIMRKRIELAAERLENTQLTVTEICYECGFRNLSHFVTSFRQHFGTTPKLFRSNP